MRRFALGCLLAALFSAVISASFAAEPKIALLLAGRPSHGPGDHEHNAGVLLLAKCLKENVPDMKVITHLSG